MERNNDVPLHEDSERILGTTKVNRWCYSNSKALDEYLALAHYRQNGTACCYCKIVSIHADPDR